MTYGPTDCARYEKVIFPMNFKNSPDGCPFCPVCPLDVEVRKIEAVRRPDQSFPAIIFITATCKYLTAYLAHSLLALYLPFLGSLSNLLL